MEEFFKQGDKEQEQGLDFSPLCDRQNTMVPQSQIGKPGSRYIVSSLIDKMKIFLIAVHLGDNTNKQKQTKVLCNVSTGYYPGFIDFIVSPTLAVCGDMVAAVLGEEAEVRKVSFY